MGYGLLGLTPDTLFSLSLKEYTDMVNAKLYYQAYEDDLEMQRLAWQSSLLMSATGNYGKKGIDMKKLYRPRFDEDGNFKPEGSFKSIDKDEKESKLNELIAKFNKEERDN
ncbi:hypothetical protein ACLVL5_06065 [Streptococcus pneumoniae]